MKKKFTFSVLLSMKARSWIYDLMKLICFLVFFVVIQPLLLAGNSQEQISIKMDNATVKEILDEISIKSEKLFFYSDSEIDLQKRISIDVKNESIKNLMQLLVDKVGGLDFEITDEHIIIKPKNDKAKNRTNPDAKIEVKGKVKDKDGIGLPGATILEEGTLNGVITDDNGNFKLEVANTTSILKVSYIGFSTQRVEVGNETNFDIVLSEEEQVLKEVVVTGYQTLPLERVTGSFAKVEVEELDRNIAYTIEDKLEGTIAGLLKDPLGITIRGVSTLNASRVPLIVLDGFPLQIDINSDDYTDEEEFAALTRKLETINPNDVENITVLKDAAAASIWGARAANGVIVITTKHTSSSEPVIEFSANTAISPKPDINRLPFANPETYLEIERGRYEAGWMDFRLLYMDRFFYSVSDHVAMLKAIEKGDATEADLTALENIMGTYDNRHEFSDYFLRSSIRQQYNLSISQNTGFNTYRFSLSFDDNKTASRGEENNRLILNFTNYFRPSSWLMIYASSNLNLIREKNNGVGINELFAIPQHQRILDQNGDYTSMSLNSFLIKGKSHREQIFAESDHFPYDWEWNIKREFDNKNNILKRNDFRIQGGVQVKPFEEMLTIDLKYQYERSFSNDDRLYNEETFEVRNKVNTFAFPDALPLPKGAFFDQFYRTSSAHNLRTTLNFQKLFGEEHMVTFLAGFELRDEEAIRSNVRRYGYDEQSQNWARQIDYSSRFPRNLMFNNHAYYIESAWSTIYNYTSRQDRYLSYFGNASYTFKDRYDFTFSIRLDKSNLFGESPKYRDVPLWSIGLGWSIDKEEFFNIPNVDRLKLRATYGESGNIDKTTSPYAIAAVGGSYTNSDIQLEGAEYTNPANPELRWEKTKQTNIGLDFSLYNNRLSGSIEYYNKKGQDLLTTKEINSTLGFSRAKINFGAMSNKGIEVVLSAIVTKKPVRWRTQLSYSYNKNTVDKTDMIDLNSVSLSYVLQYDSYRLQEGKPRYYLLSIPWGGLDEKGYPQFYEADSLHNSMETTLKPNDYLFENLVYNGPKQAPHYLTWNNIVSYKGFELSCLFSFKFGHKYLHQSPLIVANNSLFGFAQGNFVTHYAKDFERMWRKPGDENSTDIPKLPFEFDRSVRYKSWYSYAVNYGTHQVLSAAHIRFQRITLSYSLPSKWLAPYKIKRLTLALQARNLGVIAFNKYNEDPEHQADMFGNFIMATNPEYTFSIKMSF